ncbi:hypothetical protein ACFQZ4_29715 [Catellatospora coxensis]|uniref:Thioesterase superfamily protein n=1 Tax=Catellatospora coxensis TaxID=310354 RepID=A0A8J3L371_9ACTN|nr:hypothetical protein [Catellatospora coxensis]GIG11212.1 hypothetical protein Cco03nite_79120 [Catellatospora coxensis]
MTSLVIDARHNGPPGSGNGGWTSGLVAGAVGAGDGLIEITLRKPPPLDTPLAVAATDDGWAVADPDGALIASAVRRADDIPAVPPVSRTEALAASGRYAGHTDHPFPTCFVCGPLRADGLRIFPGRLADGRTAATFVVPPEVSPTVVWAALDCPGGWAVIDRDQAFVLGRYAVAVDGLPESDDECVVVGQPVRREGRKALVRSSLYAPDGALLARAEATWIAVAG